MADNSKKILRAGVVGHPISHSLSPYIHREWARRENHKISYEAIDIRPDAFAEKIHGLMKSGYAGVNVTLPHKQAALAFSDEATDIATLIGAANMLSFRDGKIFADNSDVTGFEKSLRDTLDETNSIKTGLVLGAGGASSAIILALINIGVTTLYIANRTRNKAEGLVSRFETFNKEVNFKIIDWEKKDTLLTDIVINTTSLGMTGQPPLNFTFKPDNGYKLVADIVYTPLPTQFLQKAQSLNIKTIDGLDMLMHQAVPGYLTWLGNKAVVDAKLRTMLETHLLQDNSDMILIGLTGSIGMGKSTVAAMFADLGCAVWDADAVVHDLYAVGGKAVDGVAKLFPEALRNNAIDRTILSQSLQKEPSRLGALESVVHPLVALDRENFIQQAKQEEKKVCILDIPLLFENNSESLFKATIVVSAPGSVQRKRVLARSGMTEEKFETILSRQMSDKEKRNKADYIIDTNVEIDQTRADVAHILDEIKSKFI